MHRMNWVPSMAITARAMSAVTCVAMLVALAGCGGRRIPNPSMRGVPGPLQIEWERTHSASQPVVFAGDAQPPTGITEISIEKTRCFGLCPTYTATLFSDGRVAYTGQANVDFVGTRMGTIATGTFEQLARTIIDLGVLELQDDYVEAVTDVATTYVSVVRNGARKTIRRYGTSTSGPPRLLVSEDLIDLLVQQASWK